MSGSSNLSQNSYTSNTQLPSLTPLRGIAALWVVLYHYSVQCLPNLDATAYTHLIHKGYLAVDMFFMLSGFVMTHVYHRAFLANISGHYRSFLTARIARIYPLHVLILLLFVATAAASKLADHSTVSTLPHIPLQGAGSVSAFVANVFMVQGLDAGDLSWNYPSWSISVEFIAYLLFPFALPAIWRASRGARVAIALLLLALLAVLAVHTQDNFDQWDGPITLLRCLPEFVLGTLLYCEFRAKSPYSILERDVSAFGVLLAVVLCLHVNASDFLIACLFAFLILAAVSNRGLFARFINTPALIWLGDISYSLYLIHGLVQLVMTELLTRFGVRSNADLSMGRSFALMLLMLAVCLVAANFSYFWFEKGCRRYVRDLLDSRQKLAPAPAPIRSRHQANS